MPCLRRCPHPTARPSYAVWMGAIATPEEVRARYAVDEVGFVDGMAATLGELGAPYLHTLDDFVNTGRRQAAAGGGGVSWDRGLPRPGQDRLACALRLPHGARRGSAGWLRCSWNVLIQLQRQQRLGTGGWYFPEQAQRGLSARGLVGRHLWQHPFLSPPNVPPARPSPPPLLAQDPRGD